MPFCFYDISRITFDFFVLFSIHLLLLLLLFPSAPLRGVVETTHLVPESGGQRRHHIVVPHHRRVRVEGAQAPEAGRRQRRASQQHMPRGVSLFPAYAAQGRGAVHVAALVTFRRRSAADPGQVLL